MIALAALKRRNAARWLALSSLGIAAFALLSAAFYANVTHQYAGANDFYVPWRATQAALLEGRNPYSLEVTKEIQLGMFGTAAPEGAHQWGFAYPFYVVFMLAPLAVLPYDAAQAIWHAFTLLLSVVSLAATFDALRWRMRPIMLAALLLVLLSTYPVVRAFILGQLAIVVVACVAGAWWAAKRRYDWLAGALLALATIKPQMVFLLAPLVFVFAVQTRRPAMVWGFIVSLGLLAGAALVVQPRWVFDFIDTSRAYAGYFDSVTPIQILLGMNTAALAVSALLIATVVEAALLAARRRWSSPLPVFAWGIVVSQLVAVHTATPNQTLLLLPVLLAVDRLPRMPWRTPAVVLALAYFLLVPWLVFLLTLSGNVESPLAYLPVTVGAAVWWFAVEAVRRIARPADARAIP